MLNTRLNVSNDSISSIGTESNINNQNGGGLLSFLFGSSEHSKLITKAFAKKNIAAAEFLIEQNFEIDLHYCENSRRNALHYMAWYSSLSKIVYNKLVQLLSDGVDQEVVRHQDDDGNTPLHLAVFANNYYIAELLEKNGADSSIQNKHGNYVAHDDDAGSKPRMPTTNVSSVFMRAKPETFNSKLDDIIKLFASRNTDNTESIGFNRMNMNTVDDSQTDEFIHDIFVNLRGGAQKTKTNVFNRKISTYSNMEVVSEGGRYSPESDDYESSVSSSNYSEYARAANNQKNELHEATVKKIMEVLGTDDEYRARSYKALLYQKIKEEDPENKMNGLDRATKMLSLVTKAELKKIKQDSVDKVYDYLVEKDKERKERKNNKDSSDLKHSGTSEGYNSSSSLLSEYANSQKNDLHQETVKKIMEVLGTDDEYRARSYKALLYQKIKEEDTDNKLSGVERATKMLSLATKAELKKIKKDSVDKLYDYLVTKDKERKERPQSKPREGNHRSSTASNDSVDLTTEYTEYF
jgi:hypothetical protein